MSCRRCSPTLSYIITTGAFVWVWCGCVYVVGEAWYGGKWCGVVYSVGGMECGRGNVRVFSHCSRHSTLRFPHTSQSIEFDVFIPTFSLAFEYQGFHHYGHTQYFGLPPNREQFKRDVCDEAGITLIEVPFWWDGRPNTLAALIQQTCPNQLQNARCS